MIQNPATAKKADMTSRTSPKASPKTFLLLLIVIFSLCAEAANFEVTNEDDSGPGSLRDAVEQANALPGADTITFAPSVQDISLLATGLSITDALTITGRPKDPVVIRGEGLGVAASFRVFTVDDGTKTEQPVTLSGLEIRDGKIRVAQEGGGGILNRENLTLRQLRVIDNNVTPDNDFDTGLGGGILSSGPILVEDSLVAGNTLRVEDYDGGGTGKGGGIYGSSTTIVRRSTIRNNLIQVAQEALGGGIAGSDLQIEESVVHDNIALTTGSFVSAGPRVMGGGIYGSGIIRNSTISGNTADAEPGNGFALETYAYGGGVSLEGTIQNSTVVDNLAVSTYYETYIFSVPRGGGVDIDGVLESTLVADNLTEWRKAPDPLTSTANDVNSSLSSVLRFNLISDPEGTLIPAGAVGNIFGEASISSLADHGGPTLTHALLVGSQALDAGFNPAGLLTDQRGQPRTFGPATDIGAYELGPDPTVVFMDDFETGDLLLWSLLIP